VVEVLEQGAHKVLVVPVDLVALEVVVDLRAVLVGMERLIKGMRVVQRQTLLDSQQLVVVGVVQVNQVERQEPHLVATVATVLHRVLQDLVLLGVVAVLVAQ
jgi:hypothetical protein